VSEPTNATTVLGQALLDAIRQAVKEAVREAMNLSPRGAMQAGSTEKSFLTVKQAAETSGLGSSTVRLLIRKRQLTAQKVGRRVLIKRSDLEDFLESHQIRAIQE
jgi:excisionase family DNA binding protein